MPDTPDPDSLKSVLICDDDPDILAILEVLVSLAGYTPLPFSNSKKVYEAACEQQPACILLDLWMPHISGDILVRQLKANKATTHIPVIIISAGSDGYQVSQQAGADAFVKKPFNINSLINLIQKYAACSPDYVCQQE